MDPRSYCQYLYFNTYTSIHISLPMCKSPMSSDYMPTHQQFGSTSHESAASFMLASADRAVHANRGSAKARLRPKHETSILPHKVKMQYLHFRSHAKYILLSWKIPEVISRRSILFHNWRKYLLYQTYVHTTFKHESGLTRNRM